MKSYYAPCFTLLEKLFTVLHDAQVSIVVGPMMDWQRGFSTLGSEFDDYRILALKLSKLIRGDDDCTLKFLLPFVVKTGSR